MLGGIAFQLVTITLYACLAIEFFVRYSKDMPFRSRQYNNAGDDTVSGKPQLTAKLRTMSIALFTSTVFLGIRAIYRTIELSDGWRGKIISKEVYFNVFDGAMIVLAMYTMNFVHPGVFLAGYDATSSEEAIAMKAQEA
ncbi:hypothetical protein H0H81_000228 [Sphagnurus paluster]|uniref:Uncharacterized protein n=1 Tax=Sphagnurus paluster TaxID=117069 RepID=A0A9P7KKS1_9AGAR|nr:hypothetical protein H0H81_000228 [Sphagnurus paluster]